MGFIIRLLAEPDRLPPMVLDADGLRLAAALPGWPGRLPPGTILTPHPGEMSVLTGMPSTEIQSDRIRIAERFAAEWDRIVVLKGACTVVASPDGRTGVVPISTPALARAGTGDVLAGMITGLLAQGLEAFEAAAAGAYLHARAGIHAENVVGDAASVLATDVIAAIPHVLTWIRETQ
jgi:NAD(P)H-hydrate epimerase